MVRRLYQLTIPDQTQSRASGQQRARLAQQGTLGDAPNQADRISLSSDELLLQGHYTHDTYGDVLAAELEELFASSGVPAVPYFDPDVDRPKDGYYSLSDVSVGPVQPNQRSVQRFDGTLAHKGSRRTHWRSVATTVVQVDNDFGSTQTAEIAAPVTANKRRWVDVDDKTVVDPTIQATRQTEFGAVRVYDADAPSISNPTLRYDLSYADDGVADCRVWDTRGFASREDGDGIAQWQKVFTASHQYIGVPVLSNKLLRLTFDEPANDLSAESWGERVVDPANALTDYSTGSNATASLTSANSRDGTAVEATTDSTSTQGSRTLTYDPGSSTFDLAGGTIAFWYWTDDVSGTHAFEVTDGSGTTESVSFASQLTEGELGRVQIAASDFSSADLTDVDSATWDFAGDGNGIDKTIRVDILTEGSQSWGSVSLGSSDWELYDVDVHRIGLSRIEAQVEFRDPTASPTSYHRLDLLLHRGWPNAQWVRTETNSASNDDVTTPSGLVTLLDPIASANELDPQEEKGVLARSEVRQ